MNQFDKLMAGRMKRIHCDGFLPTQPSRFASYGGQANLANEPILRASLATEGMARIYIAAVMDVSFTVSYLNR